MKNLTIQYLKSCNAALDWYSGFCGDLADEMIHHLGEERVSLLYIRHTDDDSWIQYWFQGKLLDAWLYHVAPVIDGRVHDAWFPDLIRIPAEYIRSAFSGQDVQWSIEPPTWGQLDYEQELTA